MRLDRFDVQVPGFENVDIEWSTDLLPFASLIRHLGDYEPLEPQWPSFAFYSITSAQNRWQRVLLSSQGGRPHAAPLEQGLCVGYGIGLYFLEGGSGHVRWKVECGDVVSGMVPIDGEHVDAWAGVSMFRLVADGILWRFDAPDLILDVVQRDGVYYLSICDGPVIAILPTSGDVVSAAQTSLGSAALRAAEVDA